MSSVDQFRDPQALQDLAAQDLAISEVELKAQMANQPTRYFFWARMAAQAEKIAKSTGYEVKEILWPQARKKARASLGLSGGKITEGAVDDIAMLDSDYRDGVERLTADEEFSSTLRAAEQAMRQRMEMLRSLNSRLREIV